MSRFGTAEHRSKPKKVSLGALSCAISRGAVNGLSWNGIEVLRGIEVSIRDENWGTFKQDIVTEQWNITSKKIRYKCKFAILNNELYGNIKVTVSATGQLKAKLKLKAKSDFATNRAGFTLLTPITHVANTNLSILHSDGKIETSTFPEYISPQQPAKDIVQLHHQVNGVDVKIAFDGEIFEMEDQRNWSDASFKTYCRPLSLPFPYTIKKGQTVRQNIKINLVGKNSINKSAKATAAKKIQFPPANTHNPPLPDLLLAMEPDWMGSQKNLENILKIKPDGLLMRLNCDEPNPEEWFVACTELATSSNAYCDLEIVVPHNKSASIHLTEVAALAAKAGLQPRHIIALSQKYLKTLSPDTIEKDDTALACFNAAKTAFPHSTIGAGMLTNFTELNRARPKTEYGSYITHSSSAIVHAADDVSVLQTLEALPHIFKTTKTFAGDRAYRLGLMSIGMRTNPYGQNVAPNPNLERTAMAQNDPRQRALFGAAFAIALMSLAQGATCQAIALGAPTGPFGILSSNKLFPLFHALKAISFMKDEATASLVNLPKSLFSLASTRKNGSRHAIIANCSFEKITLQCAQQIQVKLLDTTSFSHASSDINWLANTKHADCDTVSLEPFAVAFVDWEAP